MYKKIIFIFIVVLGGCESLFGAVGCTLNDPDRDIKRLFKNATNYKTEFISIKDRGGEKLIKEIEKKLNDKLDGMYEAVDVPYAYYSVLSKKEKIGYVHGVNQKGTYGAMQLILATDVNGVILDFYYQKITSPKAKLFKDKKFAKQFKGLSLADFYTKNMKEIIKNPDGEDEADYLATLRGLKKNLILHDEFYLENKYDKLFYGDKQKENEK